MTGHPYIPVFVVDYEAAVAHLEPMEELAYWRLLRLAWQTPGCSLPVDPNWIAKKIRFDLIGFQKYAQPVLGEFFSITNGRYFQKRLSKEFEYVTAAKRRRQIAGKKGGVAKALKNKAESASNALAPSPSLSLLESKTLSTSTSLSGESLQNNIIQFPEPARESTAVTPKYEPGEFEA